MIIDGIIGLILGLIAFWCGFGTYSFLILLAAYIVDVDIPLNETWRIVIKKEKKLTFNSFLDRYSYTHKFWFHKPLIILPIAFIIGTSYLNWIFGLLIWAALLEHFLNDTLNNNFDGVQWLWPINSISYKIRNGKIEQKTKEQLRSEAENQPDRTTKRILKDNR